MTKDKLQILLTSNEKNCRKCTHVSIKFIILFFHGNEIAEDDIVIPLSRSCGRKSMTVSPVSTRPIPFI